MNLTLTITGDRVELTGPGVSAAARHDGVRPGLANAIREVRLQRTGIGISVGAPGERSSSARAGRLLAESFLPEPVATELAEALRRAAGPVWLALAVTPELAWLPWEAMSSPLTSQPLALHPQLNIYRKVSAAVARNIPGPLRIVVAIAAPDDGKGRLLDYERELRNVIAAVRSARQQATQVRLVPFATPEAILAELAREPAHVLHISGHASPGFLDLEDETGAARPVSADELADLAVPPGQVPPLIC